MKKIFTLVFLTIFLANSFIVVNAKKNKNKKCFVVTAYYSPLPNQKYYATGNYIKEIILNGRGHRGASGKKVFSGMLAAPSNYAFGTKIYLNGLGIAEVADRGGAIVNAGVRGYSCDRIDIWVGHGELGLKRALYWGKRKIYGNFVARNAKNTLNIKKFASPNYALKSAFRVYSNSIFYKGIGTKNPKSDVIALQKYLKKKCLYKGKIDGDYYNILNIILNIQKKHKLIKTGKENWAGYWSASTRQLFLSGKVNKGVCKFSSKKIVIPPPSGTPFVKGEKKGKITKIIPSLNSFPLAKGQEATKKEIKNIYPLEEIFEKPAGKDTDKEVVKKYQEVLKEMGMYKGKINGNYNNIIRIIADFQIKEKLIKNKSNPATGFLGPSTRKKLKEKYRKFVDEKNKALSPESSLPDREKGAAKSGPLVESKKKEVMKEEKNKEISELVEFMGKLEIGAEGEEVKILQKTLKHFGFFDYVETGYFGEKTKKAVIKYQIARKIIKDENDIGAGYIGPSTRKSLKKDFLNDKSLLGKIKSDKNYALIKVKQES